ncbi:hypothetical protein V3W47_10765 [Deinococcus sp. YIM 134068]|uniref:hypothetical protein n=1 Tax=Deinococcus lichenicola TaxID=3118910 RepID=UPI002F94751F
MNEERERIKRETLEAVRSSQAPQSPRPTPTPEDVADSGRRFVKKALANRRKAADLNLEVMP